MADIRIGLVGAGFLAETRARCWAAARGVHIEAVASVRPERAADFAKRHAVPRAFATAEELFASPDVDLVDLCVPNLVHRSLTEAAARAGKHVLCTKPLTAYVGQDLAADASDEDIAGRDRREMWRVAEAEARAMVDAAAAAGVRLFYGENWLYAPALERASRLLVEGDTVLLEMRGWECHNGSHSPYSKSWRHAGGGALLRLGAHPIGAMLHLKRAEGLRRTGKPIRPIAVTADVTDLTGAAGGAELRVATGWQDVENWGCAILHFEDGSRGVAYGSDAVLGGMESKLELYGANAHVKVNMSPNDMLRAYAPDAGVFGDAYLMEKIDGGSGWTTPMPNEDWTSGHLPMCQAFADAVRSGGDTPADGVLGLETTRVVYAAYVAAKDGVRVSL
ncbi:MAG: Gfo/Idh/MocA family oxidoreductase [Candidatus Binatia bacterium]|nr:Gfo/Idh/MocA family oxidoreductase [Candidatus Binatia bacterium]